MEIHIIAAPQPHATLIQDALAARWPFARIVHVLDGMGVTGKLYRPPALAMIAHNDSVEHTTATIVAIRQRSLCPIVVSAPHIPEYVEIEWLQRGADVVVGEISPEKLVAIVGALMRRSAAGAPILAHTRSVGDLTFDVVNGAITVGSIKLPVTPTEFRLLESLAAAKGGCVASADLMSTVWGMESAAVRKSLKVHMSRLRRKLAEAGSAFTVNGVRSNGYALIEGDVAESGSDLVSQEID